GRALPEHQNDLTAFAAALAIREHLTPQPDGTLNAPPRLDNGRVLPWPDVLRIVDALLTILRQRRDPMERRLRKACAFVRDLRSARLDQLQPGRLPELLTLLQSGADADTPGNLMTVPPPGWIGRVLFRQAVALFSRKDHGPNRGLAAQGRLARLGAAWRFARG